MGPLHHQVVATMVPLLAARPIASTADFRGFGPRPSLLINHLHCAIRRTQGRIGQVGLDRGRALARRQHALRAERAGSGSRSAAALAEAGLRAMLADIVTDAMAVAVVQIPKLEPLASRPD